MPSNEREIPSDLGYTEYIHKYNIYTTQQCSVLYSRHIDEKRLIKNDLRSFPLAARCVRPSTLFPLAASGFYIYSWYVHIYTHTHIYIYNVS